VSEGEVAECVHEDAHLGGMALAHARHVGGGADRAAGDQDVLLSVRHPQELGSLERRGGGVPKHAVFAWGLGESDGGGCAGELAVCQPYSQGAADEANVVMEGQHVRVLMCGFGALQCALQDVAEEEGPQWFALADALPGEDRGVPGGAPSTQRLECWP
jgi:hypothetical protein